MKVSSILFLFIFAGTFCWGQTVTLQFKNNEGSSIGFVTVYDSFHNIYRAADKNGTLTLFANNYTFIISHVSYNTVELAVPHTNHDTLIVITLVNKLTDLQSVGLVKINLYEKKIYETCTFSDNSDSHKVLNQNLKLGVISPSISPALVGKLIGFKFKLDNLSNLHSSDFVLEIKLYRIHKNFISSTPINTIPILLYASQLRKKNTIQLLEQISLNSEGIFISFEIPQVTPSNDFMVYFSGSFTGNTCQAFVMKNCSADWPADITQIGCNKMPYNDKYFVPELSILYKKKK